MQTIEAGTHMILYHYTSAYHLHGIGRHGLTVGDVPTDLRRNRGRVGVWLTTYPTAAGHGLEGSAADKGRYRLEVQVPDGSPSLVRWADWAPQHVTPETIRMLQATAREWSSWYVFFGVIPPASILACVDMTTGERVRDWPSLYPAEASLRPVPAWRRDAWHRQLIKKVARAAA
jgi:hypothetical protein